MKTALSSLGQRTTAPAISWLMSLTLSRPKLVSLAAGFTDNPSLPLKPARELLSSLLARARTGRPALQYGSTAGDPELRRLTARHVGAEDRAASGRGGGKFTPALYDPNRLLITHGSQQLLYLVTEALGDPGDIVLVEDPTYFVFLGIAQSRGLDCRGVRLDEDGINLAHLESVLERLKLRGELPRVKLLYLVTYYQNPTGYTTSFAKKAAALKLLRRYERAAGHPIYLLEDAAYRELRFGGDDEPSALLARGARDRVIYTSTFSKPFATGVRVGFGFLPEPVLSVARHIKGNHDFGTANLLQQLVAEALRTGAYEQHLVQLRRRYARKAQAMTTAITRHFPGEVRWHQPAGGLYVWARVPGGTRSGIRSRLFNAALARNVVYVPGALCYADDDARRKPDGELRLSYGGATEAEIALGIARLGKCLHELL